MSNKSYESDNQHTVFFGNIPIQASIQDFKDLIRHYGAFKHFKMPFNKKRGIHRGYAFITYNRREQAQFIVDIGTFILKGIPVQALFKTTAEEFVTKREAASRSKLFLKFNDQFSEGELKDYFGKFGIVVSIDRKYDYLTKKLRNFAFITYSRVEEAERVLERGPNLVINGKMATISQTFDHKEIRMRGVVKVINQPFKNNLQSLSLKQPETLPTIGEVSVQKQNKDYFDLSYIKPVSKVWESSLVMKNHTSENLMFNVLKPSSNFSIRKPYSPF